MLRRKTQKGVKKQIWEENT